MPKTPFTIKHYAHNDKWGLTGKMEIKELVVKQEENHCKWQTSQGSATALPCEERKEVTNGQTLERNLQGHSFASVYTNESLLN